MKKTAIILFLTLIVISSISCRTVGKHWLKNTETGELELVEKIETTGTGKHKVEFQTGGKADSDSGWKVPEVNLPKMEFE